MARNDETVWFEDYAEEVDDVQVEEYDITAVPNDFNVLTIYSFLESGVVRIPGFQRNYVWDLGEHQGYATRSVGARSGPE